MIFATDYFTKYVKAKPFTNITKANTSKFIWKNIIHQFKTLNSIVLDNGNNSKGQS